MARTTNINKRVERAYYKGCSGVVINIMDISKIFEAGRRMIVEQNLDDEALAKSIRSYVDNVLLAGAHS